MSSGPTSEITRLRQAGAVKRIPLHLPGAKANGSAHGTSEWLEVIGPVPLPMTRVGEDVTANWYVAENAANHAAGQNDSGHVSVLWFKGTGSSDSPPLVRIHSTCFTGDVMGSMRCDCGPQLDLAMQLMCESPGGGMVVYMAGHEGRGIGLWQKAAAYLLQDEGLDTYEANRALGHGEDERDFRYAAAVIHHLLGDRPFRLLTNNPVKVGQMRALGLEGVEQQPHVSGIGPINRRYLTAKREFGHSIPAGALSADE